MFTRALKKDAKIFVAGHRGLVGSAIVRKLRADGYNGLVTRTRAEVDLQDQGSSRSFLAAERPDVVIVAAAKVGGIRANSEFPADFIADNMEIEHNVIWGSHLAGVPTLMFLGSSCVYPREAEQPLREDALLTGRLEPTNAPYAVAKIAGITLCDAISKQYGKRYFTAMPPNVYGPNDNFNLETSHVLPALIRKFHEALPDRPVRVWGTGNPRREFLHSDDVAEALLFLLNNDAAGLINVGTGTSVTIAELAGIIQRVTGHRGPIEWDHTMPDGFPEKTMDVSRINSLGWKHRIPLDVGIGLAYRWYVDNSNG